MAEIEVTGAEIGPVGRGDREARVHDGSGDGAAVKDRPMRVGMEADQAELLSRLHEADARYRGLFEVVADAILVVDATGRFADVNRAACELLGYTRDELLGARVADVVPIDPSWSERELARLTADGAWIGELELPRRDGSVVPVEARARAVSLSGAPAYVAALRDVGERRRVEAALRESRDHREVILRGVADGITAQAKDGRLIYANDAAAQILGYSTAAELLAAPLSEIVQQYQILDESGELLPIERLPNRRALAGESVFEMPVYFRVLTTGEERCSLVTSSPVTDAYGRISFVITIFRDVTERKRAEDRLRFLADAGAVLPSTLDLETTISEITRVATATVADWSIVQLIGPDGTAAEASVGHRDPAARALVEEIGRRYPPVPTDGSVMWRVVNTGRSVLIPEVTDELLVRAARDAGHLALIRKLCIRSAIWIPLIARGRTLGVLGLFTAESPRRYTQDDLALAEEIGRRAALAIDNARLYQEAREAIRARDEFLSIASHELRTPMTAIKGTAQLMLRVRERGRLDDARLTRFLQTLDDASDRLNVLTDDLLDVSRLRTGRIEFRLVPIDLQKRVQVLVDRYRDYLTDRHRLEISYEPVEAILADVDRLEQVMVNLVTNAVKYSPQGGTIQLTIRPSGGGALVEVRDEGIGLPPGAEETIFEPFGRAPNAAMRQIPGMGLGLHIARGMVERHGGRIWAESAGEDKGTTMRVWLPYVPKEGSDG